MSDDISGNAAPGGGARREKAGGSAAGPIPGSVLALGSAVVLAVYGAGYFRTREAAARFADEAVGRPAPRTSGSATATNHGDRGAPQSASYVGGDVRRPETTPHQPSATASGRPAAAISRLGGPPVAPADRDGTRGAAASGDAPRAAAAPASGVSATPAPPAAVAPAAAPMVVASAPPVGSPAPAAPAPVSGGAPLPGGPAPAGLPAPSVPPAPQPAADTAHGLGLHDGTYTGWGTSRHGDIEATVVVANGRIASASISRCLTRYSCSWIAHLQKQVVDRQSPEVDYVSGATQSTNAFYYAVVEALAKAK